MTLRLFLLACLVLSLSRGTAVASDGGEAVATPVEAAGREVPRAFEGDTPGYMLLTPPFPSVTLGMSVPVFVHLRFSERRADGGTMRLAFVTAYRPDHHSCELVGDCHRVDDVLTLPYRIEDGVVRVNEVRLDPAKPVIQSPPSNGFSDRTLLIEPVVEAIDGARMMERDEPEGGRRLVFTDVSGEPAVTNLASPVTFAPATLNEVKESFLLVAAHQLSLVQTGSCPHVALADIRTSQERSEEGKALLEALRYARLIQEAHDRWDAARAPGAEPPKRELRLKRQAMSLTIALNQVSQAVREGEAFTTKLLQMRADSVRRTLKGLPDLHDPADDAAFLSLARWIARSLTLRESGVDIGDALCRDPTLSQG